MSNLNSLQSTVQNLKEIVQRNQGNDHEASRLVRQIEITLAEIERKTRNNSNIVTPPLTVQTIPVS